MAVTGWESFRDRFVGYEDCYTVIGGFACEILLRHAQLNFRATKDIDMILLIEDRLPDFGSILTYSGGDHHRAGRPNLLAEARYKRSLG